MLSLATFALTLGLAIAVGAYAVARVDAIDYRGAAVVVALLLVAGGLTVQATPHAVSGTEPTDDAAAVDRTVVDHDANSDDANGDGADAPGEQVRSAEATVTPPTDATVVGVSAPDRVTYRTASGARRTVRLAGVDAPDADGAAPATFDGVLTGERGRQCLADRGRAALVGLRTELLDERVTVRSVATERGVDTAVLALDGRSINRRLVERGRARATDDRYAGAERRARSAHRGVWSCAVVEPDRPLHESGPRIAAVHPNPPGDDPLDDEYVVVENAGERSVDLSDWYLVVGGENFFHFDGGTLHPGEELVVHVGAGRDTDGHVYWGAGTPVLDDDHETIRLVDGDTDRVVRLSY